MAVKIGFIGLGNMGRPMADNLLGAGYGLKVFDIVKEAVEALCEKGAQAAESIKDAATDVDFVLTMLPSSPHVKEVYCSADGVLASAKAGTVLIDSSTIDPLTARDVAKLANEKGLSMIDAPVSGGTIGAEKGTLTFMVGGAQDSFDAAKPILEKMGQNIVHCGPSGNGQVAKLCNNMLLGICMIGASEAMSLGAKLGIDVKVLAGIINTSSGRCWSSDTYNPYPGVMEGVPASRGYTGGFGADLMLKDLSLITEAAKVARHPTPLGAMAQQLYQIMSTKGDGNKDFSGIINLFTQS